MQRRFLLAIVLLTTGFCLSQTKKTPAGQTQQPPSKDESPFPVDNSQSPQDQAPQQEAPPLPPKRTGPPPTNAECMDCHAKTKPQIVTEWKQSKHSQVNVGCIDCHGDEHSSAQDAVYVKLGRSQICAKCHQAQVDQDRSGKHSRALGAMKTMPNGHWRSAGRAMPVGGGETCTNCHRTGSPHLFRDLPYDRYGGIEAHALEWGAGACSSCHSRHTFSVQEAKQPQACEFCHSGPDADQWGMYSSSQHGILFDLKQRGLLPADTPVPTCQTCHMPNGDHHVRTAWGFRGIALPMPDDKQWADDLTDQFKALNIIGLDGKDAQLMSTIRGTDLIRSTKEDWQGERDKMIKTCTQCHTEAYAKQEMENGDNIIKNADHLLAEAIRIVSDLYKDKVLNAPLSNHEFAWLTRFDAPPTAIEQTLDKMYQIDRMRTFQGAFHSSPKYAIAQGLVQMQKDLDNIKEMAEQLRRQHPSSGAHPAAKPTAKPTAAKPDAKDPKPGWQ